MHSKQQWDKNMKITLASPSKSTDEIEKEKKRKAIAEHFALDANANKAFIKSNQLIFV